MKVDIIVNGCVGFAAPGELVVRADEIGVCDEDGDVIVLSTGEFVERGQGFHRVPDGAVIQLTQGGA